MLRFILSLISKLHSHSQSQSAIASLFALLLVGCADSDKFRIEGEVEGNPTFNLYVKYVSDQALVSGVTAVRDGQFVFDGRSSLPTLVEISDNEGRVLGRAFVKNGDKLSLSLSRLNPFKMQADGSPVNKAWADVLNQIGDSIIGADPAASNAIVEASIAQSTDPVVSALLFVTLYDASIDPVRADSVLNSLQLDAEGVGRLVSGYATALVPFARPDSYQRVDTIPYRPAALDSVCYFVPQDHPHGTLLVLTTESMGRNDSIVPVLKRFAKDQPKLEILDLMLTTDTGSWKRAIRRDTATWTQAWAPGGLFAKGVDRLAIPRLPYFIAIDSAGIQIYRSPSVPKEGLKF